MAASTTQTIHSNLLVTGDLQVAGSMPGTDRTDFQVLTLQSYPVPNWAWRRWDNMDEPLGIPAGDDLGLVTGTLGTDWPTIQTEDLGAEAENPAIRYAGLVWPINYDYVAGTNIRWVATAGALTAVADSAMTLDLVAYLYNGSAGVGSDLNGTAAQSINSVTLADYTFEIDGSGITPGDELYLRMAISVTDTATAVTKGQVASSVIQMNVR